MLISAGQNTVTGVRRAALTGRCVLLAVLMTFSVGAVASDQPLRIMRHIAMNAEIELVLYGAPGHETEALLEAGREAFAAIDALEARISRWRPDSFTALVNREASERPVTVAADLMDLLIASRHFHEGTDGVFDVTVGPLLELWGFYTPGGPLPTQEALLAARARVGFEHVRLTPETRTVFFERPDMQVDFGGIAKGLALDRAAAILRHHGVPAARLSIGTSTIVVVGAPPEKTGWTVDIRSPYNTDEETHVATIEISDESVSTSSRTERFVEIDGRRYGHLFDPRTGMPATTGVRSASAIGPTGLETDALSTAFYVMGLDATRDYCESHPEVRAILVVETSDAPETIFINFNQDNE